MPSCVHTIPPIVVPAPTPGTAASPGFQYGRAGDTSAGTYLQVIATVPSSTAGTVVPFTGIVTRAWTTNEASNTYTISIQRRDPGPVFVELGTISVVAARAGDFTLALSVTDGDELCCQVSVGSCRNVQVGLIIEQSA